MDSSTPVTVAEAQGEVEAQLLLRFLESHGIRAALHGEALRNVYGLTLDGLGRVEIRVAPADVDRAKDLIAEMRAGGFQLEEDAEVPGGDPADSGSPEG